MAKSTSTFFQPNNSEYGSFGFGTRNVRRKTESPLSVTVIKRMPRVVRRSWRVSRLRREPGLSLLAILTKVLLPLACLQAKIRNFVLGKWWDSSLSSLFPLFFPEHAHSHSYRYTVARYVGEPFRFWEGHKATEKVIWFEHNGKK